MMNFATMTGPATEALERSTKRQRTEQTDAFNFVETFATITDTDEGEESEAFPSIGWCFDDEDDESEVTSALPEQAISSVLGMKRTHTGGLTRSRAFSRDLSALDTTDSSKIFAPIALTCEEVVLKSMLEPLAVLPSGKTAIFSSRASSSFLSGLHSRPVRNTPLCRH
jgi:hypothetical protein